MKRVKIGLNEFSFAGVLTVSVKRKDLGLTRQVHGHVFGYGFLSSLVLCSSVIDCYAKCGEMSDARMVFDEMSKRDVVSWTSLISGYAKWGDVESARELFDDMPGFKFTCNRRFAYDEYVKRNGCPSGHKDLGDEDTSLPDKGKKSIYHVRHNP
ncbi:hypothetical protein M8C21_010843 [Ambrosia artemisiifolia]|uniref:Pentatricopeptide repeat-containing protein n=1 Tax=Ambrosia artemisiifolia TaxID=4212 RepID=A0AAD5BXY5_AMBAR|nr:hypothetical protein M8C21_010843 [Ambrosia artemisiifolia]